MKAVEQLTSELKRNQRAVGACRCVTQQEQISVRNGDQKERRCISETEGQVSCRGGRRERSNPERLGSEQTSEEQWTEVGDSREDGGGTRAEAKEGGAK